MKVFVTADCRQMALFGHYLHYEASPGTWEDIDLNLDQQGQGYVMDEHELEVTVLGASVEITSRDSGKGIRWLTPSVPNVAGRSAVFEDVGLTWRYTTRKTGLKLEAEVISAVGPRTYDFAYQMLGGATDFLEDPRGDLLSDGFIVPRALALGADGETYQAGEWRLVSDERIAFEFDDSSLPEEAFPYVLDPTTVFDLGGPDAQTFSGGESGDDGTVQAGGSAYPPLVAWADDPAQSFMIVRRDREGDGAYRVSNGLMRWDTSTLPDYSRIISAELQVSPATPQGYEGGLMPGCPVENQDRRYLTADWYSAWPIDSADYSAVAQTGALAGVSLDTFLDIDQDVVRVPLDNTDGVSTIGYTGLRLHINGEQPTGTNSVCFTAFDNTDLPEPRLAVMFLPEPPVVTEAWETPDPVMGGDLLTFYVRFMDLEGGANTRALICRTPLINRQNGTCESGQQIVRGPLQSSTLVSASVWSWPGDVGGRGAFTYYAFACNEFNVCSPNWIEQTGTVQNRRPAISSVSHSPDPVAPGNPITFTVNSVDSWGDTAQAHICKESTCSQGEWALSAVTQCPNSPQPTTTCTTTATYYPSTQDVGTHTYYVYVCDHQVGVCGGPMSETFTVDDGSGGGGGGGCLDSIGFLCEGPRDRSIDDDCRHYDNPDSLYFYQTGPAENWQLGHSAGVGGCHMYVATVCVQTCAITNTASWYLPIAACCYYRVSINIANDAHFNSDNVRYWRYEQGTQAGVYETYGVNQQGADPGSKCVTCNTQRPEDPFQDADRFQNGGYLKLVNESSDYPDYAGVDEMTYKYVAG
jgi:hypothetical protein